MGFNASSTAHLSLVSHSDRHSHIEREIANCTLGSAHGNLRHLVLAGLDRLPYPGQGQTLERWRILASVAAHDLSLLKLYEGHTDALAILVEIGMGIPSSNGTWGVWCAEPPYAKLQLRTAEKETVLLNGRKAWCSGAGELTHALVSAWNSAGEACLAAVDLTQPGVRVTSEGWHAVGMAGSCSVDVEFTDVIGAQAGPPGVYVGRPGFWHGGAGIAACWYGAACFLAQRLHERLHATSTRENTDRPGGPDPIRLAQLGEIDMMLHSAAAILRRAADDIDRNPLQNAMEIALRTRLGVEAAATRVLSLATRALGAGPLCREPAFARMAADLPVFLRQSHAERDMAALGAAVADNRTPAWTL